MKLKILYSILVLFVILALYITIKINSYSKELYPDCNREGNFCGEINFALETEIAEFLESNRTVDQIRLSSIGGDRSVARRLVSLFNERSISVEIKGVCLSSCAQKIVLGANNIIISEGSMVGFHHSSYLIELFWREKGIDDLDIIESLEKYTKDEADFYKTHNIDPAALLVPGEIMRYKCAIKPTSKTPDPTNLFTISEYSFYLPSSRVINAWRGSNRDVVGGYNKSEDFIKLEKIFPKFLASNTVYFGDASSVNDPEFIDRINFVSCD